MTPQNLNIRQTIEGMPLTFDGEAAGGLTAVIRINHLVDANRLLPNVAALQPKAIGSTLAHVSLPALLA